VNRLGNLSFAYNLKSTDYTHLNERGAVAFGRMVSHLIFKKYGDGREWTVRNDTQTRDIRAGRLINV